MQPQIKEGPGGLRDAHLLNWIAYVHYGTYDVRDLAGTLFSEEEFKQYRIALEFLYRVRTALHLSVGKKQDVLALDSIPELIKMLNQENQMSFVGKTLQAMHTVSLFTSIYYTKITRPVLMHLGFKKLLEHRVAKDLYLVEDKLYASFQDHDLQILELFETLAAIPDQIMEFDPSVLHLLTKITLPKKLSEKEGKAFYKLFERDHTAPLLNLFYEAGVLSTLFPPLAKVHFLAQFDGYHQYPVAIHSIKCVEALESIKDEKILALYKSFTQEEQTFLKLARISNDTTATPLPHPRPSRGGACATRPGNANR